MFSSSPGLAEIQRRIDEVKVFLSITLKIANAHTVEFFTHDVWKRFVALSPEEVLSAVSSGGDQQGEPEPEGKDGSETIFGFCRVTNRLVDTHKLVQAAKNHSLPGLGVCWSREELLQVLREKTSESGDPPTEIGAELEPEEFMNSKKSHEVQSMSEVVACLAEHCGVKQVIDVGSGKGYLSSFLSLQYGLQVYGIDSSSTNTHGAQERNRKLKKFSRMFQKNSKAAKAQVEPSPQEEFVEMKPGSTRDSGALCGAGGGMMSQEDEKVLTVLSDVRSTVETHPEPTDELFLSALSVDLIQTTSPRVPSTQLSTEERERRKRENLERKALNRTEGANTVFSPLTSYVTAETELRELIGELEDAVLVGLHTCGDLAPSTLRMFVAKPELAAVCSVGCCYHLLSEEFDPAGQECLPGACGFPLSRYLRSQSWFCGRNARMSACLALERVTLGQGIQMESLFYRAVLHVILRDHYNSYKSEKRVGNVYSKAKSFVDYVRRALRRLELDESKLSDSVVQEYHDTHRPRVAEMHAFNMLKVTLAPCIEGLILLDRLCYLKEQEDASVSALVQLFDPLLSPRCFAVVGLKSRGNGDAS
ncbi:methyltransferase-like protein 25 [Solea solea]|uniref:methyltransferase-like protein 25 n=1 Tax=Solea solea TaxID=90069 RepID=UPI00272D08BA|nr:methyltransferase-like protein 25 [Solea solea]XP_058479984.1 methyltransferase-like protein 25 [Solea solea]XP_058479986.1 methyltransferase-like protein 25 [Solea solea]XP_058479987.1 methyltransferase-like protein 25 [Solea solea]XP_058479988.1 methyltransferase-like protein 25 [Solea solea]